MSQPLRIGLVGAGPWAQLFTGPMIAGSPDATFVGVWARRPEAAASLAAAHGTKAHTELDALIEASDALCFSVPPDVQAELAARAASAGKAVLLDKPVGATLAQAEALAAAVTEGHVVSQVILTNRYFDTMRNFLEETETFDSYGGRASFFGNGAVPGTYFGTPWRVAEGGLLDLGPHVLDALDAALGPITAIEAHGDPLRLVLLECEHENGKLSQAALSANTNQADGGLAVEIHGPDGRRVFDMTALSAEEKAAEFQLAQRRIVRELAESVAAHQAHPLDVHRGVHLQRLIDGAAAQLTRATPR